MAGTHESFAAARGRLSSPALPVESPKAARASALAAIFNDL